MKKQKSILENILLKNFHEKTKILFGKHSVEKFPWKNKNPFGKLPLKNFHEKIPVTRAVTNPKSLWPELSQIVKSLWPELSQIPNPCDPSCHKSSNPCDPSCHKSSNFTLGLSPKRGIPQNLGCSQKRGTLRRNQKGGTPEKSQSGPKALQPKFQFTPMVHSQGPKN